MSTMMKAVVTPRYGPPEVLELRDVPRPEPREREVRVVVKATTVTSACTMMRRGDTLMARVVLGAIRPRARFRVGGIELCGVVDRVGARVTKWQVGDRVFGFAGFKPGAYAEAMCLHEDASLALAPPELSDLTCASLVDGPTTALFFLRKTGVAAGKRVAIIGASGSVGSAAVQLARYFGAPATAVCSGGNAELARELGAHDVVDYARADYTATGARYDVVFDAVGQSSFRAANRCLVDGGVYAPTVGGLSLWAMDLWTRRFSRTRLVFGMSVEKKQALREVIELVRAGALRPVIDRQFALADLAAAHRYVETGRKRGNVVVVVGA